MRPHSICLCLLLLLSACQFGPSPLPVPETTPPTDEVATASPTPTLAPSRTPAPTLTATPLPTATVTPQPTLTPLPTTTPTVIALPDPVVLIARPLANEFVPAEIVVAGSVTNVSSGSVTLAVLSPDGQQVSSERVAAATTVVSDGLGFEGRIALSLPPTPRPAIVHVRWEGMDGTQPAAEATQPINVLGRYGRVDRLVVEAPLPFNRGTEPNLIVRGVAPGPPAAILVRLLDNADNVLESTEATFGWYQAGLACDWGATLPNNPAATQIQVIRLGPDETVLEAVRVRLEPR